LSGGRDASADDGADRGRVDAAIGPRGDSGSGPSVDAGTADAFVPAGPELRWVAPAEGSVFVRDELLDGAWVAPVTLQVEARNVARIELWADGEFLLGEPDATGTLVHAFRGDGVRALSAVGYSNDGVEVARSELTIRVSPPVDTSCHAMLTALGLDWAPAGATRGIADPVRVQPIIEGVRFRYVSNSEPTAMLMDCELGVRLHQLARMLTPYGIDEVIHIGIYNYRCIGGGDPDVDGCTPSQHAYARAIDLHAFGLADSADTLSTEDDWVITVRGDSCPISHSNEKDRVLKEIACALWADRVFQIVLTPNYNAAHRDHFHVDMTEGSMFLGLGVEGLDPSVSGLGD
jgi:hypothetical protein